MNPYLMRRALMAGGGPSFLLRDLPLGTTVWMEEDGEYVPFLLICTNYLTNETTPTGRVLMLRKYVHSSLAMGNVPYKDNKVDTWLNGDYLSQLGAGVQQQIAEISIQAHNNAGMLRYIAARVFLLSYTELGGTGTSYPVQGVALPWFDTNEKRVATLSSGRGSNWSTRTHKNNADAFAHISGTGALNAYTISTNAQGIRPAFTLPQYARVTQNDAGNYLLAV